MTCSDNFSYLPVLGITLKHDRILCFTDFTRIVVLDLLDALLSTYTLVLGEGALVAFLKFKASA